MKIEQIIGEHKKGVRAMKYSKKPVNPSDQHAKAKEKLQPIKPMEDAKITKSDQAGVEIDNDGIKTVIPADKVSALTPDKTNPNEYDLNPQAVAPQDGAPAGPKVGATVDFTPTSEDYDESTIDKVDHLGGDKTDNFIQDVVDSDFEKAAHRDPRDQEPPVDEAFFGLGNRSPEEWAKTSQQMATLLQFREKYKGTPYAKQIEDRINLLKDRLDLDAGEVSGADGNPKPVVPPEKFDMKQLREQDNQLLDKMLTIAGLR